MKTALSVPEICKQILLVGSPVALADDSRKSSEKPTANRSYNERDRFDTHLGSLVGLQSTKSTKKLKSRMQASRTCTNESRNF